MIPKKNDKLPELRQEERYRIAHRALREAQAARRRAAKRYSEADAALAARPEGVSLVRMQLEDDLEVARRELKSAQQDLKAAEGPLISRLVICRLSTGQSPKL